MTRKTAALSRMGFVPGLLVWWVAGCGSADTAVIADSEGRGDQRSDTLQVETVLRLPDAVGPETVGPDFVVPDVQVLDLDDAGTPAPDAVVGTPCMSNEDCDSGICVYTRNGMECSIPCIEDCPQGWTCKELPPGPDQTWACVPDHITLCRPCAKHEDCQLFGFQPNALCRKFGQLEGSFCMTPCGDNVDCPQGYACQTLDGSPQGGTYCHLQAGECPCDPVATLQELETPCIAENDVGVCSGVRACGPEGLSACMAPWAQAETCDGEDNDCDGAVDEGDPGGGGNCTVEDRQGPCNGGVLECQDGALVCVPNDQGEPESCNSVDDDCDGLTDEAPAQGCNFYYLDKDEDGYGVASAQACLCTGNETYTTIEAGDCDDSNSAIHPGAEEVCDGADNNCDNITDPPGIVGTQKYYTDGDGDGYSKGLVSALLCGPTTEHPTQITGDCDDNDDKVFPGAPETCDGKDNDCDNTTDGPETDQNCTTNCGWGVQVCQGGQLQPCTAPPENQCVDYDDCTQYVTCEQCPPPAPEICDGEDDNCDGQIDEGIPLTLLDGTTVLGIDQPCGAGLCAGGVTECAPGGAGLLCPFEALAQPETCNGEDDDCDGEVDEGLLQKVFFDSDGDTFGDPDVAQDVCAAEQGWVANSLDCDDTDPNVHPGQIEICDAKDNDCNGETDLVQEVCDLGCENGTKLCENGEWGACVAPEPLSCMDYDTCQFKTICTLVCPVAPQESCNGVDDDCDGAVDEEQGETECGLVPCLHTEPNCIAGQPNVCDPFLGAIPEMCDGVDNDCNGLADDGNPGGGAQCSVNGLLGECTKGVLACQNAGLSCTQTTWPVQETCDGLDNNCNGQADDGLGDTQCGLGVCLHTEANCIGGQPNVCDPFLGATSEVCDGKDNDCTGLADDGNPGGGGQCTVNGLQGECAKGVLACQNAGLSCTQTTWPAQEICDGLDNNCNGSADEGDPGGGGACQVPGKQGPCAAGVLACQGGAPVCQQVTWPQNETCNNQDDDCDGVPDDGNPGGGGNCNIAWLQGECAKGIYQCQNGSVQCSQTVWPQSESCNNKDDDCNGQVDGMSESCSNGCNSGTRTCNWGSWGSCNAPAPQCTSGTCCDGCDYRPSSYKCNSQPYSTQYQCTAANNCGGKAQKKDQYRYCTGSSSDCGTSNLKWDSSWSTIDTCLPQEPCYKSNSTAYCKSACSGSTPQCENGQCVSKCGDGQCGSGETPANCASDCAPQYLDTSRWQSTNGSCSSLTSGWHPAGGIVYWTFGSSCSLPSTSNPSVYSHEFARWTFGIKKTGYYRVSVKIPPTGAACNFSTAKYTTGARYILDRPSATNQLTTLNQKSYIGQEVALFSSVKLNSGQMMLYLYDSVTDLSNCCDTCGQSIRVFLDYAKVEWLHE